MRRKVQEHIRNCVTCITYNPKPVTTEAPLHLYERAKIPFDTLHIDHLGPLPETNSKNKFVLVLVDGFTKYVKLYATRTTNTAEVIKHVRSYIANFSAPRRLVSDRGAAFTSAAYKKYLSENGIERVLIATACPRANGQVERYNKTLVPLLSKLVAENNNSWDRLLVDAEFLMNNSLNLGVNNSPARLLFGVEQVRRIDRNLCDFLKQINENSNEINRETNTLEETRAKALSTISKRQQYNKNYRDQKCHKHVRFEVGDLVVIRKTKTPGENNKLSPKFKGPYEVRKVLERDRYVIGDIKGYQVSNTEFEGIFDSNNLRLYRRALDYLDDNTDVGTDSNGSDMEYEEIEYLEDELEYEEIEYLEDEFESEKED